MEGRVLSEDAFATWGKQFVLYCHIVSLVKGEKYPDLIKTTRSYGVHSFMFLDADGTVLARHSGPLGMKFLIDASNRAKRLLALRKRAVKGDHDAAVDLVVRRVELSHLAPREARAELRSSGLPPAHRRLAEILLGLHERTIAPAAARKEIAGLEIPESRKRSLVPHLIDAEAELVLRRMNPPAGHAERKAAARDLAAMVRGNRIPSAQKLTWNFWTVILEHAEGEKDADLFGRALGALESYRRAYAGSPSVVKYFEGKDEVLEELRSRRR